METRAIEVNSKRNPCVERFDSTVPQDFDPGPMQSHGNPIMAPLPSKSPSSRGTGSSKQPRLGHHPDASQAGRATHSAASGRGGVTASCHIYITTKAHARQWQQPQETQDRRSPTDRNLGGPSLKDSMKAHARCSRILAEGV